MTQRIFYLTTPSTLRHARRGARPRLVHGRVRGGWRAVCRSRPPRQRVPALPQGDLDEDPVEFRGEFYRVPRSKVEPRPVQTPHPPITIGGYGPTVVRRAATYNGFNGGNVPLQQAAPLVAEIKAAAGKAGREPGALQIVSRGSFQLHASPQGKDRRPLRGTIVEIREDVARYAEAGLTELLEANFDPRGPSLERTLEVMEALAPR